MQLFKLICLKLNSYFCYLKFYIWFLIKEIKAKNKIKIQQFCMFFISAFFFCSSTLSMAAVFTPIIPQVLSMVSTYFQGLRRTLSAPFAYERQMIGSINNSRQQVATFVRRVMQDVDFTVENLREHRKHENDYDEIKVAFSRL